MSGGDPGAAFREAIRGAGLETPPEVIEPGKLHRFPTNGRAGDDAGWCKLFPDCEGGVFGDFRSGLSETWQARREKPFTSVEREAFRQRCEAERRERDAETARERAQAVKWARALCAISISAREPHPYLIRKGLGRVEGLREVHASKMLEILGYRPQCRGELLTGRLLVARIQVGDELVSVELIDEAGRKSALAGGPKKGGYWLAQELPDGDGQGFVIFIVEGVATALSARGATGYPAVAALSSGNLLAVSKTMRERFPKAVPVVLTDLLRDTGLPTPMQVRRLERSAAGRWSRTSAKTGIRRGPTSTTWGRCEGREVIAESIATAVKPPGEDLDATVRRLAGLSPIEYDRVRQVEADALGVRVTRWT